MKKVKNVKAFAVIGALIALYYLVYYIYVGLLNPIPAPGDSYTYHIPISKTILNGSFLNPSDFSSSLWYQPGASEAINSLFIFLHIPLTLSNILPTLILFFSCWKLALIFRLRRYYALLFALTIVTLNVVVRWQNAVSADMWVGVFFILAIILFENSQKSLIYFTKVGFVLGMLIGSKYSGLFFTLALTIFYMRRLLSLINLQRLLAFLLPLSIFGLLWYIRNYIFTQNPFYPASLLGFKGDDSLYKYPIWHGLSQHPLDMLNAGFGEYKTWISSIIIGIIILFYKFIIKKEYQLDSINKLLFIGLINFLFFLTFPTSQQPWIMVSSFRYSLPIFIPLILGVFLLAAKYRKEYFIAYISIANMISTLSMAYYPKLVFIYFPLFLLLLYIFNKTSIKAKN